MNRSERPFLSSERSDPPDTDSSSSEKVFETNNAVFAAALVAADQLSYLRARLHENGRDAVFTFEDDTGQGPELLRRYNTGVFPKVNPRFFHEVKGFFSSEHNRLRAELTRGGVGHEKK
jgi:hypothetical protein